MTELLGYSLDEIREIVTGMGEKPFRAVQLYEWLQKGVFFDGMVNLPAAFRQRLQEEGFVDRTVTIRETVCSKIDDTKKFLFSMKDGNCVEGVLMHYHYGYSICISTQVGCRMGCRFCASTLNGKVRDLTAGEMLGQVIEAQKSLSEGRIGHIVMMGSGEPLENYDETIRFLKLVSAEKGQNISLRHISVSTCGLTENIRRLADEGLPVTLSLSLHAPDDTVRRQIMPVANRYKISDIMDACRYYVQKTGRRVIFEYALIRDINASEAHARALAALLRNLQCHVNLIPLNEVKERGLSGVSEKEVRAFLNVLERLNISATRRREMGDDIEGACGQLRRSRIGAEAGNEV